MYMNNNINYEVLKYLLTSTGDVLFTREQIIEYLKFAKDLLSKIKRSSQFASEFHSGDLSNYYNIEESLKLRTMDNDLLDLDQVYDWMERNNVR